MKSYQVTHTRKGHPDSQLIVGVRAGDEDAAKAAAADHWTSQMDGFEQYDVTSVEEV